MIDNMICRYLLTLFYSDDLFDLMKRFKDLMDDSK